MRWEDEKYVRVYTRDTADWLALSFDAQALFTLLLRKVDRAGILALGKHGKKAVAVVLGHTSLWAERLAPALEELLADGCVTLDADRLIVPNFVAAQEAVMSGALRTREWRERSKDRDGYQPGRGLVLGDETSPQEETKCHTSVTSGDAARRGVTPCDSFLAVPSVPSVPTTTSAAPSASAPGEELFAAPAPAETPPPKAKRPKAEEAADPRHAVFIASAHRLFGAKFPGGHLTVNGKDGTHLRDFLTCQPAVTLEQFEHVYLTAVALGGKWPGCTRVADVVDRWSDLFALATGPPNGARQSFASASPARTETRKVAIT
jgi:hypothetical protein